MMPKKLLIIHTFFIIERPDIVGDQGKLNT